MKKFGTNRESYNGVSAYLDGQQKSGNAKLNKKDWRAIAILMVLVCLFTLIQFGGTKVPESAWTTTVEKEYVIVKCPASRTLNIWVYGGWCDNGNSKITVYGSKELTTNSTDWAKKGSAFYVKEGNMFQWSSMGEFSSLTDTKYLVFEVSNPSTIINEIVITDASSGAVYDVEIVATSENASSENAADKAFDEQNVFDGGYNRMNSAYFDEIYHVRTAYEYIHQLGIYEYTHPPLGKIIIAVGILIFGMNPIGWRFFPALCSVLTVLVAYLLGKKVFKKTWFATLFAAFIACDGLRYTLGRIGTLDAIVVFFILVAYYFMFNFYENGIDFKHIAKSLVPFAVSGLFFGLSIATKWTGFYAAIGLLILFIIVFVRTIKDYISAKAQLKNDSADAEALQVKKKFPLAIVATIFVGILFYVAIAFGIYFYSFAIFKRCGAEGSLWEIFIAQQKAMFEYHSTLREPHQSQSYWLTWLLNIKGVYMYLADDFYGAGMYARIISKATTLTSLFALYSMIYIVVYLIKYNKKRKMNELTKDETALFAEVKKPITFMFVGFLANLLPWAVISRATFIYHFYAANLFYIGFIVVFLYIKDALERDIWYSGELAILNGKKKTITFGQLKALLFIGLTVVNFLMFLPMFSGAPISDFAGVLMFGIFNFWDLGAFPL